MCIPCKNLVDIINYNSCAKEMNGRGCSVCENCEDCIEQKIEKLGYCKQSDLRLYEMQMKDGVIDMTFGSEDCTAFIYSILQMFKQNGGENFASTTIECDGKELGGRYALTIQRVGGLTPIEKARKDTAKEILTYVGNLHDDDDQRFRLKDYQWHKDLCKKYGIEVD